MFSLTEGLNPRQLCPHHKPPGGIPGPFPAAFFLVLFLSVILHNVNRVYLIDTSSRFQLVKFQFVGPLGW